MTSINQKVNFCKNILNNEPRTFDEIKKLYYANKNDKNFATEWKDSFGVMFYNVCISENLEMAKWFFSTNPNIVNDEDCMIMIFDKLYCGNEENFEFLYWLVEIKKDWSACSTYQKLKNAIKYILLKKEREIDTLNKTKNKLQINVYFLEKMVELFEK